MRVKQAALLGLIVRARAAQTVCAMTQERREMGRHAPFLLSARVQTVTALVVFATLPIAVMVARAMAEMAEMAAGGAHMVAMVAAHMVAVVIMATEEVEVKLLRGAHAYWELRVLARAAKITFASDGLQQVESVPLVMIVRVLAAPMSASAWVQTMVVTARTLVAAVAIA
jgi:hypothetical protein